MALSHCLLLIRSVGFGVVALRLAAVTLFSSRNFATIKALLANLTAHCSSVYSDRFGFGEAGDRVMVPSLRRVYEHQCCEQVVRVLPVLSYRST
jgi:hypothetical protein